MKKLINLLIKKPTVISIIGIMVLAFGIPIGVYNLTLEGMARLGGAYILTGVGITIVFLIADRILVRIVRRKTLSYIEIILILAGISFYQYGQRAILIDVNPNTDYFVLIENNGSFQDSELKYKFPFSSKLLSNEKNAVINSISDNFRQIELNSPEDWGGYAMTTKNTDNIEVQFYSKPDLKLEKETIDSLIRHEIKSVANIMQNVK